MDDALLSARIGDAVLACERTGAPQFLGFLTETQVSAAINALKAYSVRYEFSGGHENAERQYLAVLPDWCEETEFPITPLTFTYRTVDSLSHRDFLGSLMGLGLVREKIGDILVDSGRAVVFANRDIAKFIVEGISKVGRVGVTVSVGASEPFPQAGKLVEFSETVASLRLDCVVAAIYGLSRGVAAEAIAEGVVFVDSLVCQKPTKTVAAGNKINFRGRGRVQVVDTEGLSRKGRKILKCNKYI